MSQTHTEYDLSYTQNRELSWLKFNQRVLEEAADETVPLMERLRFVSIFTSNLDEFFMVRVGSLFDLSVLTPNATDNKSGWTPQEQLEHVFHAVRPMIKYRDAVYADLCRKLALQGYCDAAYSDLTAQEKDFIDHYYKEDLRPLLSPQIIDRNHPFPHLKNKAIYCVALLKGKDRNMLGIVDIPESVPSFVQLPGSQLRFIRTEVVLAEHLKKIFKIYTIVEQSIISVTRNADISFDDDKFDDDSPDFLEHMKKLLKQRDRLAPVRLEMQGKADQLAALLRDKLSIHEHQVFSCKSPLKFDFAYQLSGDPSLFYPPHIPAYPSYLREDLPMYEQIYQRDVLLFYPYHSMQPFLDLLRQSANDPKVVSIKITIYRLARNSAIVKHLCTAAENGKEVTVLMELRARFDEQNNIEWAEALEQAGCRLIYGPENFKCHAKICLITRREKAGLRYITQIGTGNYNEKTAALYTDFCLMTADPQIAADGVSFFQNMLIGNLQGDYAALLVAPNSMKQEMLCLIDNEIAKGPSGRIILKANSVTERQLIDKLSEASCAGVKIDLIIRGICCLVPGIPGKTENITVTSIVGRFLEHSRIYCFGADADRRIYISSADIMTRNQVRRVEVACPVKSPELQRWFISYLHTLLSDNAKARRLLANQNYQSVPADGTTPLNAQRYYLEHPPVLKETLDPSGSALRHAAGFFHRLFSRR